MTMQKCRIFPLFALPVLVNEQPFAFPETRRLSQASVAGHTLFCPEKCTGKRRLLGGAILFIGALLASVSIWQHCILGIPIDRMYGEG